MTALLTFTNFHVRYTLVRATTNHARHARLHVFGLPSNCLRRPIAANPILNSNLARFSTEPPNSNTPWGELPSNEREGVMLEKLKKGLDAQDVNIIDMSGGCGTMYRIELTSSKFKGQSILQQHRMVNELLKEEIKQMHGITLKTVAE